MAPAGSQTAIRAAALLVALVGCVRDVGAQGPSPEARRLHPRASASVFAAPSATAPVDEGRSPREPSATGAPPFRPRQETGSGSVSPGRAALLSAVLPGAGQYALGRRRAWVYAALEAAGWIVWAERRSAGADLVRRYRDFAWERARIQAGPRVDGDFDYYETLTQWTRSGAFDLDPSTTGVQPETDATTYNGMIWERAVALFLPGGASTPPADPAYQRALDYYGSRGYGADFLWDWSGAADDQQSFAQILSRSDERYRQATNVLGAILANHLVSAVDAYLSARGVATPSEVRLVPVREAASTRWHATVRLAVGR